MALNDTVIRIAKPVVNNYRMADARGLYLLVTVRGGKLWRFDYRHGIKPGTDKPRRLTLAFGTYPEVSLKEARVQRDEARKLLAKESTLARNARRGKQPGGKAPPTPLPSSRVNGFKDGSQASALPYNPG
jgi:hypothetical protein